MRIGSVNKIAVNVHWCFVVIAGIFVAAGMQREVCVVFFSVILHEVAHVVAAGFCGYKISEVEILPFGGVAKIDRLRESAKEKLLIVAVAGPLLSLLIAGCAYMASLAGADEMTLIMGVNFVLGVFNLLPAFPLDGGHIFSVFFRYFVSYQTATRLMAMMSVIVCAVLLGKLFYDFVSGQSLNLSYIVMSVFILVAAKKEVRESNFYSVKVMAYKKADLRRKGYMEIVHYAVEKRMKVKTLTRLFNADKYSVIVIIDEAYKICGTYTEIEVWEAIAEKGMEVSFADLLS